MTKLLEADLQNFDPILILIRSLIGENSDGYTPSAVQRQLPQLQARVFYG
ncbi:hypothetical protein FE848_02200 [Marinobacter sp. 1-3A]|nr:hypothetical protein [Marinobacter sp. 1-3A]MBK1872022.1 hypothetical protein [Marinobacter sp. 1-3A]